jgi:transcriptional regulator with XRE-family HTH domain
MRKLREWRNARLLSIEALAQQSGVSNKTISDIENGKVKRPAMKTRRAICEALAVQPDQVTEFMPREIR